MTIADIGPWAGVIVTVLGILYLVFGPISDLRERVKGVETTVVPMGDVPERVRNLEATHIERCKFTDSRFEALAKSVDCLVPMKMDIQRLLIGVEGLTAFAESLDKGLVAKFHSPHRQWPDDKNWKERDLLLERLESKTLDLAGCDRLEVLVVEMAAEVARNDIIALSLLLGRVQMVKRQLENRGGP
jgi:hypothetical protein